MPTSRRARRWRPAVWRAMDFRRRTSSRRFAREHRLGVRRHDVGDVPRQRVARAEVRRLRAPSSPPPSPFRPCYDRELPDICSGVVHDLPPQILVELLPADRDRRRRADVGLWRHRGTSAAMATKTPAESALARRRDVDDHRHVRGEDPLDDRAHRRSRPPGVSISITTAVVAFVLGPVDRAHMKSCVTGLTSFANSTARTRGAARRPPGGHGAQIRAAGAESLQNRFYGCTKTVVPPWCRVFVSADLCLARLPRPSGGRARRLSRLTSSPRTAGVAEAGAGAREPDRLSARRFRRRCCRCEPASATFDLVGLHWRGRDGRVPHRRLARPLERVAHGGAEDEDRPDPWNPASAAARAGDSATRTGPVRRTGSRSGRAGRPPRPRRLVRASRLGALRRAPLPRDAPAIVSRLAGVRTR